MQDFKSLCAAVTICATLVYMQTHTMDSICFLLQETSQSPVQLSGTLYLQICESRHGLL